MLWRNPPGFNANSGEFVKVQLPWLWEGGEEWHPFSLYLNEATLEGLDEVMKMKYDVAPQRPLHNIGGREVQASKTALLMIEFQNEFTTVGGKLHDAVKGTMASTQMMEKTRMLAQHARAVGARVFHLPVMQCGSGVDNPNQYLGILKNFRTEKLFVTGSWGAEIVESHAAGVNDVVIRNKNGLDGFIGTTLQEELDKNGIETIMLCGFLTNCCVESTMRSGYEKGYNVITLTDGCACNSEREQAAATQYTFNMFSTPMTCSEAMEVLGGSCPERLVGAFDAPMSDPEDLHDDKIFDEEEGDLLHTTVRSSLETFIRHVFDDEAESAGNSMVTNGDSLTRQKSIFKPLDSFMESGFSDAPVPSASSAVERPSLLMEEARQEIRSTYNTTQIFMEAAGDWTKQVYSEVTETNQLRSCWVRGPYVSPYAVASDFSHLILVATGIGITPALGIMGQYKGFSRTKFLIW